MGKNTNKEMNKKEVVTNGKVLRQSTVGQRSSKKVTLKEVAAVVKVGNISAISSGMKIGIPVEDKIAAHLNEIWQESIEIIDQVFRGENLDRKHFMKLYTIVLQFCQNCALNENNPGPGLYRAQSGPCGLYCKIKDFLTAHVCKLRTTIDGNSDEVLLQLYGKEWEHFNLHCKVLNRINSYLNMSYVRKHNKDFDKMIKNEVDESVYEIYQLGIVTWRDSLFSKIQMTNAILRLIKLERDGNPIDTVLVSGIINSYVEMGIDREFDEVGVRGLNLDVYDQKFQTRFLEESELYYMNESSKLLRNLSVPEYLLKLEALRIEETKRVQTYLHASTLDSLLAKFDEAYIKAHLAELYSGFRQLLKEDRVDDLQRMYALVKRVPEGLPEMMNQFYLHISDQGAAAIENCAVDVVKEPTTYIETILRVHNKYSKLLETTFENHIGFKTSLEKASCKFINANIATKSPNSSSMAAELLAKHCDALLRKSEQSTEEAEENLNQIMIVFKYIEEKDVFQTIYKKCLSRRLIKETSEDIELDASLISKLKNYSGFEYTIKMEKMFQDIKLCKDLNEKFQESLGSENLDVDFKVKVLTSASWSLEHPAKFTLPPVLERCMNLFSAHYSQVHSGRKLIWLYNLSSGELVTHCFKKRYTLQASTYQMTVLMLFNNKLNYSVEHLQNITMIPLDVLVKVVKSLLKIRLLQSEDTHDEVTAKTSLNIFLDFKNKKTRIRIDFPLKLDAKKEQELTDRDVELQRKFIIDTAIVRIMKNKKTCHHSELIGLVMSQTSETFSARVPVIKKCIESLIDRTYLERSPNDEKVYFYVA